MELKWQPRSFICLEGQDRIAWHFYSSGSPWCGAVTKNAIFPLPLDRLPSFWDHRWVWVCDEGCQLLLRTPTLSGLEAVWTDTDFILSLLGSSSWVANGFSFTSLYVAFPFQPSPLQTSSSSVRCRDKSLTEA